ncbi:MAG: DUF308 domain-containing protein [Bacteroidaceae bacterium]|nr:DUF308 domain-containing protein [Bacteroidaceae bacterium]
MKVHYISIIRALCSIIAGALLIAYGNAANRWFIIALGALFFVPGLVSTVVYIPARTHALRDAAVNNALREAGAVENIKEVHFPVFPIVGIGSGLLGLWLMIWPSMFEHFLPYVYGAIFVLAGVNQLANLTRARKWTKVAIYYYIVPIVLLLLGTFVVIRPNAQVASAYSEYMGVAFVVYALTELFNTFNFHGFVKKVSADGNAETKAETEVSTATDVPAKPSETEE